MKSLVINELSRTGEQFLFNERDFKSYSRKLPKKAHETNKALSIAEMMRLNKVCIEASNEIDLFHEYLDSVYFEGKAEQLAAESPEEYNLLLNDFLHGRF